MINVPPHYLTSPVLHTFCKYLSLKQIAILFAQDICKAKSYPLLTDKMPIKDITKEEKSNLYMIGRKPKEPVRITENERGFDHEIFFGIFQVFFFSATYNTVLPLKYFNLLSDQIAAKDDVGSEYSSAANYFFNNEVQNPNIYNKHNSFPLTMITKMTQAEQDEIQEIITNNVEKLKWDPVEIARHMKVVDQIKHN